VKDANVDEWAKTEASRLLTVVGAIRRVTRRAVRNSAYADPLPPARSELLRLASRRPGLSVAEAAHELRLAPNSVSTMVSQLVTDGLLSRVRADGDGRMVRLTITEQGAARVAQWRDLRAELTGRALENLDSADREAIQLALPALARLAELMEEQLSPGGRPPVPPDARPIAEDAILSDARLSSSRGRSWTWCMTRSDCVRGRVSVRRRRSSASADGGTAGRAIHSRTGAPRGVAPPHNVTIQACVYANKS
jgi:DNA-binding MarR family transcriptional regulator